MNAASQAEQSKYAATMRSFELKKQARKVIVPTSIEDVKAALREMRQPITLFGEGPYDRRERLREAVAAVELDARGYSGAANSSQVGMDMNVDKQDDAHGKGRVEVVYTSASEQLIEARSIMAQLSFVRAQQRLSTRRDVLSNTAATTSHMQQVAESYSTLRALQLESSASALTEQRPLVKLRFSPHGRLIATGSLGCHVSLWESTSLAPVASLTKGGHRERIMSLAWHPTAFMGGTALLASASADGRCLLWDCRDCECPGTTAAENSREGGHVPTMEPRSTLEGHKGAVTDCEFHPSGRYLASSGIDYSWRLFDCETSQELQLQDGHAKECTALSFQPDGSLLMTCDAAGVVLLWDVRSGKEIGVLKGHVEKITSCSFNSNGFLACTASVDNTVRVWDIRENRCTYMLPAHSAAISEARYSPSGEALLTASFDSSIRVWSTRDHQLLTDMKGHHGKVMAADFSPEGGGNRIASAGFDRTVKLWAAQ